MCIEKGERKKRLLIRTGISLAMVKKVYTPDFSLSLFISHVTPTWTGYPPMFVPLYNWISSRVK